MKFLLFCAVVSFYFVSCNDQNRNLSEVENFVETLKENKAEGFEAPDFNVDHISELLNFRNEQMIISNFPRNPVSSFYLEEVAIGIYILWTIESIRMEAINDPDFHLYASLNPKIVQLNTGGEMIDQSNILPVAAEAYFEWWNSNLSIEEKLQISPLENLDLIWN